MADPSNPTRPNTGTPQTMLRHDTVLLTDTRSSGQSSASSLPQTAGSSAAPGTELITNISPAALAALGQRYDILAEAGHGSMGNVYKARDRETGEIVALKLLKPEIASDQAMMDRFKNEMLFARKITHKNVCRVYDFNRIAGIAYTSMEFVNGESLRSVLNRFGGLPTRKAVDIGLQICSGLKEAHAQGIVHRDLKPENVMIDAQGNVKIMDFGIARSMDMATRLTGTMVGTPAYMAPEQVAGKAVDYRTDIYSLGLVLYEVFTGVPAFHADSAVAVALKQMNEAPPPPHTMDPSFPAPIERVILRCLEKEPAKRFASVGELAQSLSPSGASATALRTTAPAMTPHPAVRKVGVASEAAQAATPLPGTVANPFYSPAAVPPAAKSSTSPFVWLLLGGLLVLGALGGEKLIAQAKLAEKLPAPAVPSALVPVPPDFALNPGGAPDTAAPTPAADSSPGAQSAGASAGPSAPQTTISSESSKTAAERQADAAPTIDVKTTPAPVKKSSGQGGTNQSAAAKSNENSASIAAFHSGTYLWVGRYDRKQRADDAAKQIEDLGLPALVVPRRGLFEEFYIVLSGPYEEKRLSSVSEWLREQGFREVREFKLPVPKQATNP